jgi:hypothetical protein
VKSIDQSRIEEKMITAKFAATISACAALAGCGSLNSALAERQEMVEIYHVWDVKTSATPDKIIKATADGIARNTNSINQIRPLIKTGPLPDLPGRFEIVDGAAAMRGTGFGSFMAMAGGGSLSMNSAICNGAVWSSQAIRNISGSDHLRLFTCLYRYKTGYQINQYAIFTKRSGGVMQLAREASQAIVGTPEEWLNKTIVDTIRSVESSLGVASSYVEGQPAIGNLPKVDAAARL